MIKNLNKLSFGGFGLILKDIPAISEFAQEKPWREQRINLPDNTGHTLCLSDKPVYLERITGMAVLGLSKEESPDEITCFYLDKPVKLHPGVCFFLRLLGSDCTVRQVICEDSICRYQEIPGSVMLYSLSPVLTLKDIYTLFYQEREKGFFFRGEQHHPYELIYVDRGELHSVTGGQDFLLKQGEMMVYAPDQWHMQYTEPTFSVCFITLSFDMECPYSERLTNRIMSVGSEATRLLDNMLAEQDKNEFLRDDMLLCYLKEFLLHIFRQILNEKPAARRFSTITTEGENAIVERALKYIAGHVENHLTVSGVAQRVSVSTSYLSALFRKHLGFPPSVYIRRMKLSESKQLIREGKQNLTQISQLLGYSTLQHFSRCFKEEYGVTPSEYARAMK